MIEKTLMILGPGGIGKSPIDSLVRADVVRIDPYRLRSTGPRDRDDVFYAHPRLRSELTHALRLLGDPAERISDDPPVAWFAKSLLTMFDVRGEWQCLPLGGLSASRAKAEIYAPALVALLRRQGISKLFGTLTILVLNPVESLRSLGDDFSTLRSATAENCTKRGDSAQSVQERMESIDEEAHAWVKMLDAGGTECANWQFPEYAYRGNETATRLAARARLIIADPAVAAFLKTDAEIPEAGEETV